MAAEVDEALVLPFVEDARNGESGFVDHAADGFHLGPNVFLPGWSEAVAADEFENLLFGSGRAYEWSGVAALAQIVAEHVDIVASDDVECHESAREMVARHDESAAFLDESVGAFECAFHSEEVVWLDEVGRIGADFADGERLCCGTVFSLETSVDDVDKRLATVSACGDDVVGIVLVEIEFHRCDNAVEISQCESLQQWQHLHSFGHTYFNHVVRVCKNRLQR